MPEGIANKASKGCSRETELGGPGAKDRSKEGREKILQAGRLGDKRKLHMGGKGGFAFRFGEREGHTPKTQDKYIKKSHTIDKR